MGYKIAKTSGRRSLLWEYRLYFALIFAVTLPHTQFCFLKEFFKKKVLQ